MDIQYETFEVGMKRLPNCDIIFMTVTAHLTKKKRIAFRK